MLRGNQCSRHWFGYEDGYFSSIPEGGGVVNLLVQYSFVSDPLAMCRGAIESRGIGLSPEPKIIV